MKLSLLNICLLGICTIQSTHMVFATDDGLPSAKKVRTEQSSPFHSGQMYGIPTYDALFKFVLSDDKVRLSFLHAFAPDLKVEESERLDEHMNPAQSLQLLRDFINHKDTQTIVDQLKSAQSVRVKVQDVTATTSTESIKAVQFLQGIVKQFDDLKRAFPKERYDGTMDFVCRLKDGNYALVEMQVIPQDYWDRRALAYVAAFYGNQLREGQEWKQIKRVIGINILGGGKDDKEHWKDRPGQYVRHYKIQEQLHGEPRYIDGFEIIQYSIMHAPGFGGDQEKQDWITFLKHGHRMTKEQVETQIKTLEVRQAFERARIDHMPADVQESYKKEDLEYSRYSEHTKELVTEGRKEERLQTRQDLIKTMLSNGGTPEQIALLLGISIEEIRPYMTTSST